SIPLLPTAFLAESDYGFFVVSVELPPGTSLAETDRVNGAIEDVLRGYPQIDHYVSTVGGGDPFAGVEAAVERAPTNVLMRIPGAIDVERTVKAGKPGSDVSIDRSRTADLGISAAQVGLTVRTLLNGEKATSYRVGEHTYDVVVRLRAQDRLDTSAVLRLPITTLRGTPVPLSAVATLSPVQQPVEIDRTDRLREILVGAAALGRDQSAVSADVQKAMADVRATAPSGVRVENAGDLQRQSDSFASLFSALGLSVLCVYVLLALQFGNFVHPFTIMMALPLSIVGALVALLIGHQTFDIVAMIGIILLMGLVTKNSILLVA